jgi:two-component system, LytTR family, response regulator
MRKVISVLIIDDEPLVRTSLVDILSKRRDVEVIDSAEDAVDAIEKLGRRHYDVLLLDIDMPEVSGIALLDQMREIEPSMPAVVVVTADERYAITAFEKHAVDYVLKPFTAERITQALDRAQRRTAGERAAKLVEMLPLLQKGPERQGARIAIKCNGRIVFVDPNEVVTVQAQGNYVLLQCKSGASLLREPISVIADKLEPCGFIRIHRSVLVNRSFVEEIQPYPTGEYGLRVQGGKEYTVTRTYKRNLRSLAEFWIGSEAFLAD